MYRDNVLCLFLLKSLNNAFFTSKKTFKYKLNINMRWVLFMNPSNSDILSDWVNERVTSKHLLKKPFKSSWFLSNYICLPIPGTLRVMPDNVKWTQDTRHALVHTSYSWFYLYQANYWNVFWKWEGTFGPENPIKTCCSTILPLFDSIL